MITRCCPNDYAPTFEIEVDDVTGTFIRLIRAWAIEPGYMGMRLDEPEIAITPGMEKFAAESWAKSYAFRGWHRRASSPPANSTPPAP